MATASSSLCMVALHRPNSTTGMILDRNLASDVPPVVDNSGSTPVTCVIASAIMPDNSPGGVRNGSPEIIGFSSPPLRSTIARTISLKLSPLCSSLKRMDKRPSALAGMTLWAGLPTWMSVNSILLGWNQSVP